MKEIDDTTERIIQELARKSFSPNFNDFKNELRIGTKELNEQLALLETYDVAKLKHTPMKNTVEKLPKLGEVFQAGGLTKYLEHIKIKERAEAERISKSLELTELQLSKIKEELKIEVTKQQSEFYQLSAQKLSKELDEKVVLIQDKLKKEQSNFFTTSSDRNNKQIKYFRLMIIIAILSSLLSGLALYQNYS